MILYPLYTKKIPADELGKYFTLKSFNEFLGAVVLLSLTSAYMRFYIDNELTKKYSKEEFFSTYFWFIVFWGSICITLFIIAWYNYGTHFSSVSLVPYFLVSILALFFEKLSQIINIHLSGLKKSGQIFLVETISQLLSISLALILILKYEGGLLSLLCCALSYSASSFILYIILVQKSKILAFKFNIEIIKQGLIYAFPLIPVIATAWINTASDKLMISYYGVVKSTAYYSLGLALSQSVYLLGDGVTRIYAPELLLNFQKDTKNGVTDVKYFYKLLNPIMVIGLILLTVFSKELIILFSTEEYIEVAHMLPILGCSYLLGISTRPFVGILSHYKKTKIMAVISIISAVINAILNLILIPKYGEFAAATTTFLSSYLCYVLTKKQAIKYIELETRIDDFKEYYSIAIVLLLIYWNRVFGLETSEKSLILKLAIMLVLIVIIYLKIKSHFGMKKNN